MSKANKRDLSARGGGYNVTGELINYETTKPINENPNQSTPGLPYKIRRRMSAEREKARYSLKDYLLCAIGILSFMAMCYYMVVVQGGVQYGR